MAHADEAARYRTAAQAALDQLDWCAEYLQRIHKAKIARQLAVNTSAIRHRIDERGRDAVTPGQPG